MSAVTDGDAMQTRWDRWQRKYDRSSRRNSLQARVVGALIFAAIIVNLLIQLSAKGV